MKILGISGRKQAGKNTTANILHGLVLERYGLVEDWTVGDRGELRVLTRDRHGNLGWGELDICRKDEEFAAYADQNMWPYVKLYSFADSLKWMCTELFEIPYASVWGTDAEKNKLQPHLLWENMPGVITREMFERESGNMLCDWFPEEEEWGSKNMQESLSKIGLYYHDAGPMTAREFMQLLGTEIGRKMFEPIWINATLKKIKREQPELAIIADVRFPNEGGAIDDTDGLVARLTRTMFPEDTHYSETAMDNYPFKYFLDNEDEPLVNFIVKVREFYTLHLEPQAVKLVTQP